MVHWVLQNRSEKQPQQQQFVKYGILKYIVLTSIYWFFYLNSSVFRLLSRWWLLCLPCFCCKSVFSVRQPTKEHKTSLVLFVTRAIHICCFTMYYIFHTQTHIHLHTQPHIYISSVMRAVKPPSCEQHISEM